MRWGLVLFGVTWRYWPWRAAAAWGGGAVALLAAGSVGSDGSHGGTFVAALSNGLLLFFIVGGLGVTDDLRRADDDPLAVRAAEHPWLLAAVPAAATLATLLPLRLGALGAGLPGPWSSIPESTLDIACRTIVVYAIVGLVAARR